MQAKEMSTEPFALKFRQDRHIYERDAGVASIKDQAAGAVAFVKDDIRYRARVLRLVRSGPDRKLHTQKCLGLGGIPAKAGHLALTRRRVDGVKKLIICLK